MKKIMLVLMLAILCSLAFAQPYLAESFENDWTGTIAAPANWTQAGIPASSSDKMWAKSTYSGTAWSPAGNGTKPAGAQSGSSVAWYNDYFASSGQKDSLITPAINITASTYPRVSFYYMYNNGSAKLRVYASANGTTNWVEISPTAGLGATGATWTKVNLDLSAYKTTNLKIAIVVNSSYGSHDIWLDSFVIEETPLAEQIIPLAVTLKVPSNNDITTNNPLLKWTPSTTGEPATGYKVYLNTTNSFTDPIATINNYTTTTYQTTELSNATTYYWKVVAYNVFGNATGGEVFQFTTPTTTQLAESFEGALYPPLSWSLDASSWVTSTTAWEGLKGNSISTGSVTTAETSKKIITPKLAVTANSTLKFYAYTSSSTVQYLTILSSPDKVTWTNLTTTPITVPTSWALQSVDLSSLAGSNLYFAIGAYRATASGTVYLDHIIGPDLANEAPGVADNPIPATAATNITDRINLSWSIPTLGGVPTGYKVYFGTEAIPTTLIATINQPLTTVYKSFSTVLNYNTPYYWQIVPFNGTGDATGCPIWSFTTFPDQTISTVPYTQNFDTGITTPNLPLGWYSMTTNSSATSFVGTISSTSPKTTPNHVKMFNGTNANSVNYIVSPPFTPTDTRLRFFAKGLSSPISNITIGTMSDPYDTLTFVPIKTIELTTTYTEYLVKLNPMTHNRIAFKALGGATGTTVYLDNIQLETIPNVELVYSKSTIDFGRNYQNRPKNRSMLITNNGAQNANITLEHSAIITTNQTRSVSILPDQTFELILTQTPVDTNSVWSDSLIILSSDLVTPRKKIVLQGKILPFLGIGVVELADGAETNQSLPIEPYFGYSLSQSIYYPSELYPSDNHAITQISYEYNKYANWATADSIKIWFDMVPKTEFLTTTDWVQVMSNNLVYQGTIQATKTTDWITLNLTKPFIYDSTWDLVVTVQEYSSGYHTSSDEFFCTSVTNNRSLEFHDDDLCPNAYLPSVTGSLKKYVPNTRFKFEATAPHLTIMNDSLVFNRQFVGSYSAPKTANLMSTGTGNVWIDSLYITYPDTLTGQFTIINSATAPFIMGPGTQENINVVFNPTVVGRINAQIHVVYRYHNTDICDTLIVDLAGNSVDATINDYPYVMDFSGEAFPPYGWTSLKEENNLARNIVSNRELRNRKNAEMSNRDNQNTDNWLRSMTSIAGEAPELQFHWSPSFEGRSMFISPVINATGKNYIKVSFDFNCIPYQMDRNQQVSGEIGLMVKSGANDWQKYWYKNINQNIGDSYFERIIDISLLANPKFQIAFYYEGNTWAINDWFIDNLNIQETSGIFNRPGNLTATAGYREVQLNWNSAMPYMPNTLTAYNIYRDNTIIDTVVADTSGMIATNYMDNSAVNNVDYNYYVTAVYVNPAGESVPTNQVMARPMIPDYPNGIALHLNVEMPNVVHLNWNMINNNQEFRYDDGVFYNQVYNQTQNNTNFRLGNVFRNIATVNEVSWFSTANQFAPHDYANIHIYGLDLNGNPDNDQLIWETFNVPNIPNSWNTYILPNQISTPNGFIVCVDFPNGSFEMGMDDGIDAPWEYVPNVLYLTTNVSSQEFSYLGGPGWSYNLMVRAKGTNYGPVQYPKTLTVQKSKTVKNTLMVKRANSDKKIKNTSPQRIPFGIERLEVYRNNDLIKTFTTQQNAYIDTLLTNGSYEYFIKAYFTDGVANPESNHETALIGPYLTIDRDTINYQKFELNRQTPFREINVFNPGSVPAEIDTVYITDNVNFTLEPVISHTIINPNSMNMPIRVAFNPTTLGTHNATLVLVDSSDVHYNVVLTGLAVDPTIISFPYHQNFSSMYFPPLGWRSYDFDVMGDTLMTKHFMLNESEYAGGEVPELSFVSYNYQGNLDGKALFISPVINATGIDNMIINFKDAVEGAYGLCEIGLAVKSVGDPDWVSVWAERPENNYSTREMQIEIDITRLSNPSYQFAFYFKGNSNRLYQWMLDNITLDIKPPLPPTQLLAYPGNNAAHLHWLAPGQEIRAFLGYNVYRDNVKINENPITENQYSDTNVINNDNYHYYVTAVYSNPALESEPSNTIRVTPLAPVLNPPQGMDLSVINEDDVVVQWNRPSSSMLEDFEIIMPGWKTYDADGNEQSWTFTQGRPHSGMYSVASFAVNNYYYGHTENWLISPRVHISGDTELKYWIAAIDTLQANNDYYILVSTESDSIQHFTNYFSQESINSSAYGQKTVDLSEFSGQNIYIAWVHDVYSYYSQGQGLLLDDVSLVNQSMRTSLMTTGFENVTKSTNIAKLPAIVTNTISKPAISKLSGKEKLQASSKIKSEKIVREKINSERTSRIQYPYTKLIGYKVYRNNSLIETVGDSIYSVVDLNRPDGTQSYQIFAVYNKGISQGCQNKKAFVGRSIMPSPNSKDFGTLPVLGQSQGQLFALVNNGTKKIKPRSIVLSDTTNFGMVVHQTMPDSMLIGDTLFVSINFKPQTAGEFNATFTIIDSVNNFNRPVPLHGIANPLVVNNYPFTEMFSGETFPADGWSTQEINMYLGSPERSTKVNKSLFEKVMNTQDRTTGHWSKSATMLAGGEASELKFSWNPAFSGVSRFISPIINGTNKKELLLQFKQFVDWYETGFEVGVSVRRIGETDWSPIWSIIPEDNIQSETVNLNIPIEEMQLDKFQFCFYFYGSTYQIDYWYVDNIKLFEPSQGIPLTAGWNIISANLLPSAANMMDVFQPLIQHSSLSKVQNEAGASLEYVNGTIGWVNDIGNYSNTEGYKVKVTANDTLWIAGQRLDMPYQIPLLQGWNIMGYPSNNPMCTYWLFNSLVENNKLVKVQDETGAAFEFVEGIGWIDNIGTLYPGEGYKVKVSSDTLVYFDPYIYARANQTSKKAISNLPIKEETKTATHFTPVWTGNGVDHMNLYITSASLNDVALSQDNEIGVFDGNVCVGAIKLNSAISNYVSIVVSKNENTEGEVNGYTSGHQISFRIWNGTAEFVVSTPQYTSGTNVFEAGASAVVAINANLLAGDDPLPILKTALNNAYPNPFNPTTKIDYSIKTKSKVTIEVYNVKGQRVKTLVNENKEPGKYNVVWSGDDNYGKRVSSGIYFYRMEAGSFKAVKKAVLLK